MSPNTRKVMAAVIALILVVAMVLPVALSALR